MTQAVVFISYSRKDEVEKDKLVSHLGVLQGAGLVDIWHDDRIGAGQDWQVEINLAIAQAKIAILLITANFLNSRFILGAEAPELLRRRQSEGLVVFPIIARACAWRAVDWLRDMNVRPKNSVPVWSDGGIHVDEYLSGIAEEISVVVQKRADHVTRTTTVGLSNRFNDTPCADPKPSKSWRILVVDDEPTWQRRLSRILREINCTVVTAGNYEQGENLLTDFDFDLVTIDLNLDKSTQYADGLELVLRIREVFGNYMPVIIITGTGSLEEQRRSFKEYNVFDFIQKAKLDLEEFQKIVIEAIGSSRNLIRPQF